MRELSGEELTVLVGELRAIEGFYIDKFYEPADGRFRLRLSKKGAQASLQIILPRAINLTSYAEAAETPTNFSMAVRKRITGFMISSIERLNDDRIVVLGLKRGDTELSLVLEMFGKGNLVITDKEMNILLAYMTHEFKDRSIRIGSKYAAPVGGGRKVAAPPSQADIAPTIYRDGNGVAVDYSLRPLEKYAALAQQKFPSLQEALDAFYNERLISDAAVRPKTNPLIEELESSIRKQEQLLGGADKEISENKERGGKIFASLAALNQLIEAARARKRATAEELAAMFPGIRISRVDLKEKTLLIEL